MKPTVFLVHWNAAEAKTKAALLRTAGYVVSARPVSASTLRGLLRNPPAAVIIDLTRLPAQGRDVAIFIRHTKATRGLPLVLVEGDPAKVARIKRHIPDAEYTTWSRIRSSLRRAIAHPPADPVAPSSVFAGYAGVPLAKKLGIKANTSVALIGAPQDFHKRLGDLPDGVSVRRRLQGSDALIIWFVKSQADANRRIASVTRWVGRAGVWIAWPKRGSAIDSGLSQPVIRRLGEAHGLVDYKVASIDDTWTGLKFACKQKATSTRQFRRA